MKTFDPIWEQIYGEGRQLAKYPYSSIVSLLFSQSKPMKDDGTPTKLLEVGCGAGNNLWFAAREGYATTGLDASEHAINYARQRFADDGLDGKFDVGDFTQLPYGDNEFDIAIERGALSQTPKPAAREAISEVARVLHAGALFYAEIYSDRGTSRGTEAEGGVLVDIEGPFAGIGQMAFYSQNEIESLFAGQMEIVALSHTETLRMLQGPVDIIAYWSILARNA